jgi:hypothetical protein
MGATTYLEGAAGLGLVWYGFKKESGIAKWALIGFGAYLLYSTYQTYSGTTSK